MNRKMPQLMYGTAWKKEATADLVEMAVLCGFRGIDTACQPKHYHEAGVGEAIKRLEAQGISRDELFIQTKFTPLNGQDPYKVPYNPDALLEAQVAESFEVSKRNLGCDYIDSLVLHSPIYPLADLMRVWKVMEQFVTRGEVGRLGISNCYDVEFFKLLYADATIKPSIIQNRFYAESGYDMLLRAWSDQQGVVYQSFWTLTANPHLLADGRVQALARHYGVEEVQILYRYLTQIGIVPLIGSTSQTHLEQDLKIFDFSLDSAEMTQIGELIEEW